MPAYLFARKFKRSFGDPTESYNVENDFTLEHPYCLG